MDGFVNRRIVAEAARLLDDDRYRQHMVDHNYYQGSRYYGYSILRYCLQTLINNIKYEV